MAIEITVTIKRRCQECEGNGGRWIINEDRTESWATCVECDGEGVPEQQMGLREFRHKMEEDALAEQEEADAASGYDHHIATECM